MSEAELKSALDRIYAGSKLASKEERTAWLKKSPAEFKAFIETEMKRYAEAAKNAGIKPQ